MMMIFVFSDFEAYMTLQATVDLSLQVTWEIYSLLLLTSPSIRFVLVSTLMGWLICLLSWCLWIFEWHNFLIAVVDFSIMRMWMRWQQLWWTFEWPNSLIIVIAFSIQNNVVMVFQVFVDLKHRGLMDNTVVVVTTDNGGGPWDSNTPLRGTKVGDA